MLSLEPSDYALIIDLVLSLVLAAYFAVGKPRVWQRDRLGWVIFSYAVAVVALLSLIVYGIVFGQKIGELARFPVAFVLGVTILAKIRAVYLERKRGRLSGSRAYSTPNERLEP